MCGRFTLVAAPEEVAEFFQVVRGLLEDDGPRFNIAPTQNVLTIHRTEAGREPAYRRWGLIPAWTSDTSLGVLRINARSETVATTAAFRGPFRKQRCLVPASGFYEWKKAGARKQPMRFGLREGGLFAFAGLWDHWTNLSGSRLESCAILTTSANELVAPVHDRMPVILDPSDYDRWLDPANDDIDALQTLTKPFRAEAMRVEPVSDVINNARHEVDPRLPAVKLPPRRSLFDPE